MKLSQSQSAVLQVASTKAFIDFYDASRAGGNGKTLHALTQKGLLVKHERPDGSNEWSITEAGRAALGAKS